MKRDELNYECEVLDPVPTDPDWKHWCFHADDLGFALDHLLHVMRHQGIKKVRWRKLGTTMWRNANV